MQHIHAQVQPAPLQQASGASTDQALAEIRVFASQMREMTELVCRMQAEMTGKLAAATQRMDVAAEAVSAAETRVSARIAEFERLSSDVGSASATHQKQLAATLEQAARATSSMTDDLLKPLKSEAEGITRHIAESGVLIRAETAGLMTRINDAAAAFNAQAETAIRIHTERFTETVGNALLSGQTKLSQTTEALNEAAGALARGILAATEQQDDKARDMAAFIARMEALGAALPDPDAVARREQSADVIAQRIENAVHSLGSVTSGLAIAATQVQAASAAATSAAQDRRLGFDSIIASHAETKSVLSELAEAVQQGMARVSTERTDASIEILSRFDELGEKIAVRNADAGARVADAERDSMLRLTMALRLVLQDIGRENGKLNGLVDNLGGAVETMRSKLEAIELAQSAHAAAAVAAPMPDASRLPDVESEKTSLRRLLTGFRLLLQDINGEAGRFREMVDGLSTRSSALSEGASAPVLAPDPARLDAVMDALAAMAQKLDAMHAAAEQRDAAQPQASAHHAADKESLQRVLAGFKLLLRDIAAEAETFRGKVAAIEPVALSVDAMAPVREAAERISEGVAESLAAIEIKLDGPLAQLAGTAAESANLLKAAHAALSAPPATRRPVESQQALPQSALADAVARLERASDIIDARTAGVDQLLGQLKRGAAAGDGELANLVDNLAGAAELLRREAGDFLAVSAALSRDLERTAGISIDSVGESAPGRRPQQKKRAA
jgi:hypothetical protein